MRGGARASWLLPAQLHAAKPPDVMLTSPPCLCRTKQAALGQGGTSSCFSLVALPPCWCTPWELGEGGIALAWVGSGGVRQLHPVLPVWVWLLVPHTSGYGWQICLLQQLKNWKKMGGKYPVYRHRAKPRCDGALDHACASLTGRTGWERQSLAGWRAGGRRDLQLLRS